jgi:excisionase family DNA binding protein
MGFATVANASRCGPGWCGMGSKDIYRSVSYAPVPRITLRPNEAAESLGISVSSLERLVKAGEIPRFKDGGKVFFRVASLDAWAASREAFEGRSVQGATEEQ